MRPRLASLLLATGTLAGVALSLYADLPAAALAAWVLATVGTIGLTKVEESFSVARNGAILCIAAEAALLADVVEDAATWVRFVGVLLLLTGAAAAFRTSFQEGFRADAAERVSSLAYLTVIPLALLTGLIEAQIGPAWVLTTADVFAAATTVAALWFAAFCVAQRDALVTA